MPPRVEWVTRWDRNAEEGGKSGKSIRMGHPTIEDRVRESTQVGMSRLILTLEERKKDLVHQLAQCHSFSQSVLVFAIERPSLPWQYLCKGSGVGEFEAVGCE